MGVFVSCVLFSPVPPECSGQLTCPCTSGVTDGSTFITEALWVSPELLPGSSLPSLPALQTGGGALPGSSLAEMGMSEGLKERAGPSHSVVQGERQEGPGWLASVCPLPALQRVAYKQSRAVLKVTSGLISPGSLAERVA